MTDLVIKIDDKLLDDLQQTDAASGYTTAMNYIGMIFAAIRDGKRLSSDCIVTDINKSCDVMLEADR